MVTAQKYIWTMDITVLDKVIFANDFIYKRLRRFRFPQEKSWDLYM